MIQAQPATAAQKARDAATAIHNYETVTGKKFNRGKPAGLSTAANRPLRASDIDPNDGLSLRGQLAAIERMMANKQLPDDARESLQKGLDEIHAELRKNRDSWGLVPVTGENVFGVGVGTAE